jgi:hypothetical protein
MAFEMNADFDVKMVAGISGAAKMATTAAAAAINLSRIGMAPVKAI